MIVTENQSVIDSSGNFVFFSIKDFKEIICLKNTCFLCGTEEDKTTFTNEHIIPKWILKKFDLFSKTAGLINGENVRYDRYKIKCCKKCNELLGVEIEDKICKGFNSNYSKSKTFFNKNKKLVFIWLALIYLKTNLNDRVFKIDKKSDKSSNISDLYNWEMLHHFHCLVRSLINGSKIKDNVIGTMRIFPTNQIGVLDPFDYIDSKNAFSSIISLGDFCIITIFNDSGIINYKELPYLNKITGELLPIQQREIYAKLSFFNNLIMNRPRYCTGFNLEYNLMEIFTVFHKNMYFEKANPKEYGESFYFLIKHFIKDHPSYDIENEIKRIKSGMWSYLIDEDGKFKNNPFIQLE